MRICSSCLGAATLAVLAAAAAPPGRAQPAPAADATQSPSDDANPTSVASPTTPRPRGAVKPSAGSEKTGTAKTTTKSVAATATSTDTAGIAIDEVKVTAQRREQRLQDVPVAVSVFTGAQLARQQTTNTEELIRLVPNTSGGNNVGFADANTYFIRGLGQTQTFTTFEPQVGTYVNDIYISRQNDNNFALFDLQNIQVLRGPQGTLFGRNNTGGAIVVTLNPPSPNFGGFFEESGGGRGRSSTRGSVDVPLSDQVLTKTSVFGITDNGYVRDITTGEKLNDVHDVGVREAVRLTPRNSNIIWDVTADYSDNVGTNVLNMPDANGNRVAYTGFRTDGNLDGLLTGKKASFGQGADVKSYGASSDFAAFFDSGNLHIITGYRGFKQDSAIDFPDNQFGPLVPDDQDSIGQFALGEVVLGNEYTQEIKWNSQIGSRINYTAGLYYLYETDETNYGAAGFLPAAVPFPVVFGDETFRNTTNSIAAYGQGDYNIVGGLTATAGLRYTLEHKTLQISPNLPATPGLANILESPFNTADVNRAGFPTTLQSDVVTPRFALQYRFDPAFMTYASATKGFQGGGWNSLAFSAGTFNNFGIEKVWSYETGFHYAPPAGRFRADANVFLEEVAHYQLLSTSSVPGNFTTQNAAGFEDYGFEGDLAWVPRRDLTLSASLGLQKGTYNNPAANVVVQQKGCVTGRQTHNATLVASNCGSGIVTDSGSLAGPVNLPSATVALTGNYVWRLPGFTLSPSGSVQFAGRQNVDISGSAAGSDPAYVTVDGGVTFKLNGAPWTFTAECRNCAMQNYGVSYLFGHKYYNDPGIWDVRLNYKF